MLKISSILWVILKKSSLNIFSEKVRFFGSYSKKKLFNSLSHQKSLFLLFFRKPILRVIFQKNLILWDIFLKESLSLRVICKKVQFFDFCESYLKRTNQFFKFYLEKFLWVMFKRIQFLESYWKRGFNALNHIQFFESNWKKKSVLNSVSRIEKGKVQFSESYLKSSILLSHIFQKKINTLSHFRKFNSLSHIREKWCSIRCDIKKKKQRFNSLSHVSKRGFNSLSHIVKKKQKETTLWVMPKKVQFFESYEKVHKGSILRVSHICKKGSILRV